MKKRIITVLLASVLVMSGCQNGSTDTTTNNELFEQTPPEQSSATETVTDTTDVSETSDSESTGASEDYTQQIQNEINEINASSESISDELVKVNELYNKYDLMRMSAETQADMNELSQWPILVWKFEDASLADRIVEKDPANSGEYKSEYDRWESYVTTIAEQMSYVYEGGSIQSMIINENIAMRYKQDAYSNASALADLNGEVTFSFPDSTPCGFYGAFDGDCYLIITEGMESDSYNVRVHIDDDHTFDGTGYIQEYPGGEEVIHFTSDDDTIKGIISYFALGATFYVSETDGAIVGPEEAYDFTFKY